VEYTGKKFFRLNDWTFWRQCLGFGVHRVANADVQGAMTLDGDSASCCRHLARWLRYLDVFECSNCDRSISEPHSFSSLHPVV